MRIRTLLAAGASLAAAMDVAAAQDADSATRPPLEEVEAGMQEKAKEASAEPFALKTVGSIERYAPEADAIIPEDAEVRQITPDVFGWTEGPLFVGEEQALYFTDVPGNGLYRWTEEDGFEPFLVPSGDPEPAKPWQGSRGANGLAPTRGEDADPGTILMTDHGTRAIYRLDLGTKRKTKLADRYGGARFSSPNDLVQASDGSIYFTDPPFGLVEPDSPAREIATGGVYRRTPEGNVELVDDGLGWPNGVAFSPSEDVLYVSVSRPGDGVRAGLYAYDMGPDGAVGARKLLFDATDMIPEDEWVGLPDGMDVAADGTIFLSGPYGIHVLTPEGERLALVKTGRPTSNATLDDDETTLYIASSGFMAAVPLKPRGGGAQR